MRGVRLQQTLRIEGVRETSSAILSSGLASLYDPICFHLRDLACEHVTLLAPRPSRRQRRREDNQPERRGSQERDGGHLRLARRRRSSRRQRLIDALERAGLGRDERDWRLNH